MDGVGEADGDAGPVDLPGSGRPGRVPGVEEIPEIDVDAARAAHRDRTARFVDIRDPESFREGHVPGAMHLHDGNVGEFVASSDKATPVIVYCYHGNNSLGGTAFLIDQGFRTVHSLRGGFEAWSLGGPVET